MPHDAAYLSQLADALLPHAADRPRDVAALRDRVAAALAADVAADEGSALPS